MEYETVKDENNKVINILINYVNLSDIVEEIYPKIDPNNNLKNPIIHQQFNILSKKQKLMISTQMLITRYCIYRILTHFKLFTSDIWTFKTSFDYYGEEVQSIFLKPMIVHQVDQHLDNVRRISIAERLESILKLEYGHLIPSVIGREWFIKKISPNDLIFSNTEHFNQCKIDNDENPNYKKSLESFPYPRGICCQNPNGTYKVIDGYHRLVSIEDELLIIYCLKD